MLKIIKHLWLGTTLVIAASCLLLFSDLSHRKGAAREQAQTLKIPRIAIMQIASARTMDETVAGMVEELKKNGYTDGETAVIKCFNASGDYTTATAMARDIVSGDYDLILTAGTPTLQTMANANKDGKKIHVFGTVTDPYGSGVGITGPEPDQHPKHLVGIGTFQPVDNTFEIARKMNPNLKRVGTVWNPTEHNAEACVIKARAICKKLGIELIEANASSTTEVPDAIQSVIARDAEAIWVGGDIITISALPTIVSITKKAGIPVFTNTPNDVENGALFSLGASYDEVGRITARMAVRVLKGEKPSAMRIDNVIPERLAVDENLRSIYSDKWNLTNELRAKIASAAPKKTQSQGRKPEPGRTYKIGLIYSTPHKLFDEAIMGVRRGLEENGFIEGKNLKLSIAHANGEVSMMPQIVTQLTSEDPAMIISLSTPCLAVTAARVKDIPVVFAEVTEPVGAGAGKSFTDHQPNVTGAVAPAPLEGGFAWLMKLYPNIKKIGMVYSSSEPNVQTEIRITKEFAQKYGFELVLKMANNPSEVPEALSAVMAEDVDAFFIEGDNSIMSAQPLITSTCKKFNIPVLGDDESEMGMGELLACGVSPEGNGHFGGQLAARVLLGEDPATIPFTPSSEYDISIDFQAAKDLKLTFPAELIKDTTIFHNIAAIYGRPAKIAIVNIADNPPLNSAQKGVIKGLADSGLVEGKDFVVQYFNAQNDMTMLSQSVDAAINANPDLIITVGTPTALAATAKSTDIPIVFTVCSDPAVIGIVTDALKRHMTGVYEVSPAPKLLDFACREYPGLSKVGIIYDPSEVNSRIAVDLIEKACAAIKITLVKRTASTSSELPEAAQAMVVNDVGVILTSADNLVCTSLSAIVKVTKPAGIPIFANDVDMINHGANAVMGYDYGEWGVSSGHMAAKILAGLKTADLPPVGTDQNKLWEIVNPASVKTSAATTNEPSKIRIVAYNETTLSEENMKGLLDGFKKAGLVEGRDYSLRIMNAQGDMATLSSIMGTVKADDADMLICISTPTLQAALRQASDRTIVFTGVADGICAGAGKTNEDHMPNVTGITTQPDFASMAKIIKAAMPDAQTVGTLFTPSEINSVIYKDCFAEELAKEGIELEAVPVTSTAEIAEASASLCQKKISAICQIVDNTTRLGFTEILRKADDEKLPVFGFDSSQSKDGAVLTLSRDHYDAGLEASEVAVRILRGEKPAGIPFANTQSESLIINFGAAAKNNVTIPSSIIKRADRLTNVAARFGRPARVAVINMADNTALDDAQKGVVEGLCDKGLVEGKDFEVKYYNAHGDFSLFNQLFDTAANANPDVIIPIGTPTVQALANKGSEIPTVYTVNGEPVATGIDGAIKAGWMTGVYLTSPVDELVEMAQRRCPGLNKAGVMFNPGEFIANEAVKKMRVACAKRGIKLEERAVSSANEAPDAIRSLIAADVEVILTSCDSVMHASIPAVVKITAPAGIPIFANELELVNSGATASIGYSFEDWGRASGRMAAQILAGLEPTEVPPTEMSKADIHELSENKSAAKTHQAQPAAPQAATSHKPWKLRVVAYSDTSFVNDMNRGIDDGLNALGLVEGKDYELRRLNAQGDMSTLTSIMTSVRSDEADLVFCLTTPALQAGVRQSGNIPVVFCGIANAIAAGAGISATEHQANVTGIVTQTDFDTMVKLIRQTLPNAKRVGTLFSPSETNSVFYKDLLTQKLAEVGIETICVPVNTTPETIECATTLCAKDIDLVCQILDNTTRAGFPNIVKIAKDSGIPTYCFEKNQFKEGAVIAVAYDYHDTAVEAAKLGVRILKGEKPATIPFLKDNGAKILINDDAAREMGIVIPQSVLDQRVK